jgi:hypothetical protein
LRVNKVRSSGIHNDMACFVLMRAREPALDGSGHHVHLRHDAGMQPLHRVSNSSHRATGGALLSDFDVLDFDFSGLAL